MEDKVFCILIDSYIQDIECIENSDCVRGMTIISSMPNKYKTKENWQSLCKNCQCFEQ